MTKAFLILGAELRSAVNKWRRADPHAKRFRTVLLLLAFLVCTLLFAGSWRAFHHLNHGLLMAPELGPALTIRLIEMAHLLFFVMLFISALSVSLSVLYLDPEIVFLRSAPVGRTPVLVARLLVIHLRSSWFVLFTAAPILAGWAAARSDITTIRHDDLDAWIPYLATGTGRLFVALVVLEVYTTLASFLGAATAVCIARFIPARQAKVALLLLSVMGLSLAVIGLRAMTPERFLRPRMDPNIGVTLAAIATPASPWFPSGWAARAIVDLDTGAAALVVGAALLAAFLATLTAVRFHADGLERFLVERDRRRGTPGRDIAEWIASALPRPLALVAAKDLRLFARDPSQWSQLIILLALVVIYVFNFRQMRGEVSSIWLRDVLSLVNLAMAGFVLVAVANRFVFAALSLEGRAIWLVRSSPFPMHDVLRAKTAVALLPLLVLAELITVLANQALGTSQGFAWAAAALVAIMSAAITCMGVGLGALTPRFDLRDPAQIGMTPAGILFMGSGITYVGGVVLAVGYVLLFQGRRIFLGEAASIASWIIPLALLAGWTLLATILPWRLGLRHSAEMELR